MWQIMERFGGDPKFLNIRLHEDQHGQVIHKGYLLLKQGYVLAPTLFTIFFSMILNRPRKILMME